MTRKKIEVPATEFWNPTTVQDTLQGTISRFVQGKYGIQAVVTHDDGTQYMTPSHALLQQRIEQCKVGDYVYITYTGEVDTKNGKARAYEVEVETDE